MNKSFFTQMIHPFGNAKCERQQIRNCHFLFKELYPTSYLKCFTKTDKADNLFVHFNKYNLKIIRNAVRFVNIVYIWTYIIYSICFRSMKSYSQKSEWWDIVSSCRCSSVAAPHRPSHRGLRRRIWKERLDGQTVSLLELLEGTLQSLVFPYPLQLKTWQHDEWIKCHYFSKILTKGFYCMYFFFLKKNLSDEISNFNTNVNLWILSMFARFGMIMENVI